MTIISSQEIAQYRSQLSAYNEALTALDTIEDCDGDLEDAAITIGIRIGQQPDDSNYLDGLAKRYRVTICQHQEDIETENLATVIDSLQTDKQCPPILATLILIYASKQGIERFCEPLKLKIEL